MLTGDSLSKRLYGIYKEHLSESALFANAGHWWKLRLSPFLRKTKRCRYKSPSWRREQRKISGIAQLRLAVICDEMTWQSFYGSCQLIHLTPQHWREELERFRPDAFFCESAWEGSVESGAGWRWRIYRNHALWFENRRELLDILRYCREAGIPTLFWNKEDPPAFSGDKFDFIDTALKFDHIFTTAGECVETYTKAGHKSVHTLMFGFSPKIFHPLPYVEESSAVFHGSWYAIHPKRCEDMRAVFDMLLGIGIPLTIYDRQSEAGNPKAVFPDEYKPYLRPAVPYDRILETLEGKSYAVNINTITGSATMFARRVFEMMACGLIVVSNQSVGIKRLFGSRVWFAGEEFDSENRRRIRRENIVDVFLHHTWRQRIVEMLTAAGVEIGGSGADTAVIYRAGSVENCGAHFSSLEVGGASGLLWENGLFRVLNSDVCITSDELKECYSCFLAADADTPAEEYEFMLSLREFTDSDAAIAHGGDFEYKTASASVNWLIPSAYIDEWIENPGLTLKAYMI